MQPPETRYVARPDGVSIAYQVFGAGPPDLLVAPGLGGSRSDPTLPAACDVRARDRLRQAGHGTV